MIKPLLKDDAFIADVRAAEDDRQILADRAGGVDALNESAQFEAFAR